jgi:anaerobic magnesium-protoporphyrin IX monomethyl ester cyclase
MQLPASRAIDGADLSRPLDALFVNAPLRDYSLRPRTNNFTLPVLGMGYIATYAAAQGLNVGVVDAEAHGLGIGQTIQLINEASPRWAGFNLLAPTYEISARIAAGLDDGIRLMASGHQAKAMPAEILADPRFGRLDALRARRGRDPRRRTAP